MAKLIKKITLRCTASSYSEIGHLKFWKDDTLLTANRNGSLTLANGDKITMTFTATSYSGWPANYAIWDGSTPDSTACSNCWCSSSNGGTNPWTVTFNNPISMKELTKITFCCGQNHSSYPSTITCFLTYDDNSTEQMGEPLYVNSHNGIFEWRAPVDVTKAQFFSIDGKLYKYKGDSIN